MKVINVLPLGRGVFRESLSYFTGDDSVSAGSIVSVPVRSREIPALVISVKDPVSAKSDLKSSEFELRKITKIKSKPLFLPEFVEACEDTARFFAGTPGAIVSSFSPKAILESPPVPKKREFKIVPEKKIAETLVIQGEDEERFSEYKSLVRERFARNLSVYICFPTTQEALNLVASLDRGIKDYSYVLHSGLPRAKLFSTWKAVLEDEHPVLVIGTSSFLSIPRPDIGTIIIEKEGSRFYKSERRPYADSRVFAQYYAKRRGVELILGDAALRVETVYKAQEEEYAQFGSQLKSRSLWGGTYKIVDMRRPIEEEISVQKQASEKKKEKFVVLSDEVKKLIQELPENNERLFLFTSRRGLSPLTLCGDCGTVVNCTRCSAPTTLHRGSGSTFFLCHHCGEKRDTAEKCRVCGSWKLETFGIGIELVEEAIKKEFPDAKLLRLDKDTAPTQKKAQDIAEKFYASSSGILLGTELALYYLKEKVQHSAVISIDSLFSLPDFRIQERIFSMLLSIRAKTEKRLVIQTRNTEASVLGYAATGALTDFYREEIEVRKLFTYPPFSILIKISIEGKKDAIERELEELSNFLEGHELEVFPAFLATGKGKHAMNALIKVKRDSWPDDGLIQKLRSLPPHVTVEVDPSSIL